MRMCLTIAGNFLIPIVFGGFIFGMVLAGSVTPTGNKPENPLVAMAFAGQLCAIGALLIFFLPGMAYSLIMGILSVSLAESPARRKVMMAVALVAGLTLFPLWIKLGDTGFGAYWWVIALISGPVFVLAAYLLDKLPNAKTSAGNTHPDFHC